MSTVLPRLEFATAHGIFVEDWPCAPRAGDYIRVATDDHGDDKLERVDYLVWSSDGITVATDCVDAP